MNKLVLLLIVLSSCIEAFCQENPEVTKRLKEKYPQVFFSDEGYYYVWKIGGSYLNPQDRQGLYDKNGDLLLECKYTFIDPDGEYAIVSEDGVYKGYDYPLKAKFGLFSLKEKKMITGFDYGYISFFSEKEKLRSVNIGGTVEDSQLWTIVKGGKWGFMGEDGKIVITPQYDKAGDSRTSYHFVDGVCQVEKDGKAFVIKNPLIGTGLNVADGGSENSIDFDIPEVKKENENTFAFIFANENYVNFKGADYSINDGSIFAKYCKLTLGLPEENVRYYEDATYGNMVGAIKRMKDIADVYDGEANLILYFSGLGATDEVTKNIYILPSDASLPSLRTTGCNVDALLQSMGEMSANYVLVILDAPFSNKDKTGKAFENSRGVVVSNKHNHIFGKVILCTGGKNEDKVYSHHDYGHGLLTYAILEKIKSMRGNCSIMSVLESAKSWVGKESLKKYDDKQTPRIQSSMELQNKLSNLKF